jgi:prevent-host-death family protein
MLFDEGETTINAKDLRATLKQIVAAVRKGKRFTVLYRSRPAFRIVPVDFDEATAGVALEDDPIYRAPALGRAEDADIAADHDEILYG